MQANFQKADDPSPELDTFIQSVGGLIIMELFLVFTDRKGVLRLARIQLQ
jgi:hypothetical protein